MSYRIGEKKKPKPRRTMQKTNTPGIVYITNGSTFRLAHPCHYIQMDNAKIIKSEEALEAIANNSAYRQPGVKRLHDSSRDKEIHFRKEYENPQIEVVLDGKAEGLTIQSASIDEYPYDFILRIVFNAQCPEAQEKELTSRFTIKLIHDNITDVVAIGKVIVLPAIL